MKRKVLEYKHVIKIHRSHGQHAQPVPLGQEFLWWMDAVQRQMAYLKFTADQMVFSKISGAVGTYSGGLSPKLEELALANLGLKPAGVSAQIILRDRHTHVMNALAVLARVIEHIALNVRLYSQTEICELQEFFTESQKGSSIMPHKKNPVRSENLSGLARVVCGNASSQLESIPTWGAHDISHSSVERVVWVDNFHLVHFMLKRITAIIGKLVVNEDRIKQNLHFTDGMVFSPDVKKLLMENGMDPDLAYRIAQGCAFAAYEKRKSYLKMLLENEQIPERLKDGSLQNLFDLGRKVRHTEQIYFRYSL